MGEIHHEQSTGDSVCVVAKTSVSETATLPIFRRHQFRIQLPGTLSQNRVSESPFHYLHSALTFETMETC